MRQIVDTAHNAVGAVVGRSDSKAATLLGVVGLALGAAVTVLASSGSQRRSTGVVVGLTVGWLGALMLAGSAILLVLTVRPNLRVFPLFEEWISSVERGSLPTPGLPGEHPDSDESEELRKHLAYVRSLVGLVERKHRRMRKAANLLLISIPLFVVAAVTVVLAG